MKKRILSMLLAIVMVVGMLPGFTLTAAAAATAPTMLYVLGTDALTTSSGEGWSYADGVLTLTNANLTAGTESYEKSCPIYFQGSLTITFRKVRPQPSPAVRMEWERYMR